MRCSHAVDDKRLLRASVLAARQARSPEHRDHDQRRIAGHGALHYGGCGLVAAYAAVGSEPGTRPLLDRLRHLGGRVLLPCVRGPELVWGDYLGWDELRRADNGLLEPVPDAEATLLAASADVVLVPALAVDRVGHRLGRGAGYYDRWLRRADADRPRVAVVYAEELLASVPHEPHDVPMTAALTPDGLIPLG